MQANLTPSSSGLGFSDILDIVKNEKTYSKKLEELQALIKEQNKSAAKLTKAKNLDNAIKNAKEREEKAEQILAIAESKRDKILEDVGLKSASIMKKADAYMQEVEGKRRRA